MVPDGSLNPPFSCRSDAPAHDRPFRHLPLPRVPVVRILACLILLRVVLSPAMADEDSHDRARRALQAGEIVPLDEVLAVLAQRGVGQVLEVELEHEGGRWIYEVETLSPDGVITKHLVDAKTKQMRPYVGHEE
jgi:hypothetical protein